MVEDVLRKEAAMAVENLRELGVATVGILSGDRPENVRRAAEGLRLDFWHGGLLPHEKMEHFQRIRERAGETILFVGDGMNDAEMLSMAGKGCIMEGAHQRLKDLHPELEVIGSNADDAVPHYLRQLYLD